MTDRIDLLWRFYNQENDLMTNEESQRATVTNLILVLAGAVLAIIGWDHAITPSDLPLTLFLTFIGIFGVIFALTYRYSRDWHSRLKRRYLVAIVDEKSTGCKSDDLVTMRNEADKKTRAEHPITSNIPKWLLWAMLSGLVAVIGIGLSWIAIFDQLIAIPFRLLVLLLILLLGL